MPFPFAVDQGPCARRESVRMRPVDHRFRPALSRPSTRIQAIVRQAKPVLHAPAPDRFSRSAFRGLGLSLGERKQDAVVVGVDKAGYYDVLLFLRSRNPLGVGIERVGVSPSSAPAG